jgi:glycosyltransferase involved in cell wall biosynthesis
MKPIVSIIMPALNSERTIAIALQSIENQSIGREHVEILVIDGGSKDATLKIAKKFGCVVLQNPRIQQEYAKHIGLMEAKGDYALFLDSDEQLSGKDSIVHRVKAFKSNPGTHIVFSSGYKPTSNSLINRYVSTFGDPFGYFMYNTSPDYRYYVSDCRTIYKVRKETESFVTFHVPPTSFLPLVDLCAGVTVDMKFLRKRFDLKSDVMWIPKIPSVTIREDQSFAIVKNEYIIHDSAESFSHFTNKLNWRTIVNIHYKNIPGTGYSNREDVQPNWFNTKKYFFMLYAFSIIGPLFTTTYFFVFRKNTSSILHLPLTLFVASNILVNVFAKIAGHKPDLHVYGKIDNKTHGK